MIRIIVLALMSVGLLFAPAQVQDDTPVNPPAAVQPADNSAIVILAAVIAIVVPLTTVVTNFLSTRNSSNQSAALSKQAEALVQSQKTVEALIIKLDGLPLRVSEQLANNLIREQFGNELKRLLIDAGLPIPPEPPQKPLTPMRPPDLLQQLELERLDRSALGNSGPTVSTEVKPPDDPTPEV